MIKDLFLVPDYYPNFRCKGNSCRKCCCGGWGITLNKNEYYKIQNVDCSPALKDKIAAYVRILNDATLERYAKINLNYQGECPLRLPNGYCGLQVEVGEEEIPSICRYYPRAPRLYPSKVSVISSSCEWLIEELIKDDKKITFKEVELSFNFDKVKEEHIYPSNYREILLHIIDLTSDRNFTFNERLRNIASYLETNVDDIDDEYIKKALKVLFPVYIKSHSIGEYVENINTNSNATFKEVYDKIHTFFPDIDTYFEKIFINHFVYMIFPFVSTSLNQKEAMISLFLVYHFYLTLLYFNLKDADKNQFVDISSEYFRIVEHSNIYEVMNKVTLYIKNSN